MKLFGASIARWMALNIVAICVLLFQALVPGAGSVVAVDSNASIICSNDTSPSVPVREHHHSGFCCILGCAVHHCAYSATIPTSAAFPSQNVSSISWDLSSVTEPSASLIFYFSARGPPVSALIRICV
jgi:hypothetical protein